MTTSPQPLNLSSMPSPLNPSSPQPFSGVFSGKSVWISGHTGFKGSWLTLWLLRLGAKVHGFSLPPPTSPSLFEQLALQGAIHHEIGDIRDQQAVRSSIERAKPDFVFHLAAQPLVRLSYAEPAETFSTNILGTVHVMEALRHLPDRCAAVVVTSDKCYENDESGKPFSEGDALGGRDPYSASKAACEIVAAAYRDSFFSSSKVAVATARAGNVIGGGDWARDRLVPDCIRALSAGKTLQVRTPHAVRPWQHVLEPLCGYLRLAQVLSSRNGQEFSAPFNFGPCWDSGLSVEEVVLRVLEFWPGAYEVVAQKNAPPEAHLLRLSTEKAEALLGWHPVWDYSASIGKTLEWYRANEKQPASMRAFSERQIEDYLLAASESGMLWKDLA